MTPAMARHRGESDQELILVFYNILEHRKSGSLLAYSNTEFSDHETHQIRTLCPDPDTLKFGVNA